MIFDNLWGLNLNFHAEKHRQLHIILAIIVSVFSACVVILVAYMVIFPASYSEVDSRPRENSLTGSSKSKVEDDNKVGGQRDRPVVLSAVLQTQT